MQHLNTDIYKLSFLILHQSSVTHEKKYGNIYTLTYIINFSILINKMYTVVKKIKVPLPVQLPKLPARPVCFLSFGSEEKSDQHPTDKSAHSLFCKERPGFSSPPLTGHGGSERLCFCGSTRSVPQTSKEKIQDVCYSNVWCWQVEAYEAQKDGRFPGNEEGGQTQPSVLR